MTIGIALKYEDIRADDYDVVNSYAGSDKSWHDVVCHAENVRKIISFSRLIVSCALIAARHDSKER